MATKHVWITRFGFKCCKLCGFVKNPKLETKPCRGKVRVELRDNRLK